MKKAAPKKRRRKRRMYFDNDLVESLVIRYQSDGCTDLNLRDEIMSHADELIVQVMRANTLTNIYPYRDQTAEIDLFQTAWTEIERSLYKFDSSRGTKIFNLWTQVARASMLALIKREGRDRKNQKPYQEHLKRKVRQSLDLSRFFTEAKDVFKDNHEHLLVIDALESIYERDEKPADGLMAKLIEESGLSRVKVKKFLDHIRMRMQDFSDAPIHDEIPIRRSGVVKDFEGDD